MEVRLLSFPDFSLGEIFCQEMNGLLWETQLCAAEVVQTPNEGDKSLDFSQSFSTNVKC